MFPKLGVPAKWMVYNGKPYYSRMDDLGVPLFLETPISKNEELLSTPVDSVKLSHQLSVGSRTVYDNTSNSITFKD